MEQTNAISTVNSDFDETNQRRLSQANILERQTPERNRKVCPPRGWPIKYLTWGTLCYQLT